MEQVPELPALTEHAQARSLIKQTLPPNPQNPHAASSSSL